MFISLQSLTRYHFRNKSIIKLLFYFFILHFNTFNRKFPEKCVIWILDSNLFHSCEKNASLYQFPDYGYS